MVTNIILYFYLRYFSDGIRAMPSAIFLAVDFLSSQCDRDPLYDSKPLARSTKRFKILPLPRLALRARFDFDLEGFPALGSTRAGIIDYDAPDVAYHARLRIRLWY